jgi:hypothetical protein
VALAYVIGFGFLMLAHGWQPDPPHKRVETPAAPVAVAAVSEGAAQPTLMR